MQLHNVNSSFITIKFAPNLILNLVPEPCFDAVIADYTAKPLDCTVYCRHNFIANKMHKYIRSF